MHRDIKRELQRHSKSTLIEQQFAFDKWRHEFNHVRPSLPIMIGHSPYDKLM